MGSERRTAITAGSERTHWILVELRSLLTPVASAGTSILLTLWTAKSDNLWAFPQLLYLCGALLLGMIWLWGYLTWLRPRYSELAKKKAQLESELEDARLALQSALDALLTQLLKDLNLDVPSVRVSVYSVEGDRFVLLSRRSANASYERRGRPTYPLDQGVIGRAWSQRSATHSFEVSSRDEWNNELVLSGNFSIEDASSLTMLARSIAAVRVDTGESNPVGMIVFESDEPDAFESKFVERLRRRPICNAITSVVTGWHEHFPRAKEYSIEAKNGRKVGILKEPEWKAPGSVSHAASDYQTVGES